MSKETTEIIKYKFEVEDSLFLSKMNSIQTSLKGTDDIALNLQKSFNGFSSSKMTVEVAAVTKEMEESKNSISNNISMLDRLSLAMEGASNASESLSKYSESIKNINENGVNLSNTMDLTSSSISAVSSSAAIGTAICPGFGTAIGALVGVVISGITAFEAFKDTSEELLNNTVSGLEKWGMTVQNAKSHLSEFDDTLFASNDEIQELEKNMKDIQSKITTITKAASDERRSYTDEEIKQLNQYFEELKTLNDKELEIQELKSKAIMQQAKTAAEANYSSLEEYRVTAAEWTKTAEEQKNKQLEIINEQTTNELTLLNQRYGEQAVLSNEAYKLEYDAIMARKAEKVENANVEVGELNAIYTNGYLERTGLQERYNAATKEANDKLIQFEEEHAQKAEQIFNSETLSKEEKKKKLEELNDGYYQKKVKLVDNVKKEGLKFLKSLNEEEQGQLGTLLNMAANTELYGGEMDDDTTTFINSIIDSYDSLPNKTKDVMKNSLEPMLTQMEEKEPVLFGKAKGIADGIISRLKTSFDIHSPSKKTKAIFKNVMLGMEEGIAEEENNLNRVIEGVSAKALGSLTDIPKRFNLKPKNVINFDNIGKSMKLNDINIGENLINMLGTKIAMSINNKTNEIEVYVHTDEGTVVDRINQKTKQTGVCPIRIPI